MKTKIIETLTELKNFFDGCNEKSWSKKTQNAIQNITDGKLDLKTIFDDFVGAGMGSLIDLYICTGNGHALTKSESETNKELERLVEELLTMKIKPLRS